LRILLLPRVHPPPWTRPRPLPAPHPRTSASGRIEARRRRNSDNPPEPVGTLTRPPARSSFPASADISLPRLTDAQRAESGTAGATRTQRRRVAFADGCFGVGGRCAGAPAGVWGRPGDRAEQTASR